VTDGSPRKTSDGAVLGGGVDDGGGSDMRSPAVNVGSKMDKEVVQSSSRRWLGRRRLEGRR
jgi:hypothetical protein